MHVGADSLSVLPGLNVFRLIEPLSDADRPGERTVRSIEVDVVQQGRSLHNSPPVGIVLDQCRQNVVVPIAGIDSGFVQRNETQGLRTPAVFDEISDLPGFVRCYIPAHEG